MRRTTGEIWKKFSARLKSYIVKRIMNPADADDILQEVFVRIHNRLDSLQDERKLAPWLFRITQNAIVDYYRRRRDFLPLRETENLAAETTDDAPRRSLAVGLRFMIEALPPKYRDALLLTEFEGLTQREMAARLGLSLSGAKSRVQRARGLLREMLLDCCRFEFDRRGRVVDYVRREKCCEEESRCEPERSPRPPG